VGERPSVAQVRIELGDRLELEWLVSDHERVGVPFRSAGGIGGAAPMR
jgi:hypothetical protein